MEKDQVMDTGSGTSQTAADRASQLDPENIAETSGADFPSDAPEDQDIQELFARTNEEALMYKDRWMRLAAEFDNYRKRTGREFSALVKNASASLITQLLPVVDNMERALHALKTTGEPKAFAEGVEMIHQQFVDTLRREGLQDVEAVGHPFDPNRHEAVMAIENEDQPAQSIVEVVEKGYLLNERVIRPAKVIVTRRPQSE